MPASPSVMNGTARRSGERPTVVLVTGASTGVGLALGRMLVADPRYRVILTARRSSLPRFAAAGFVEGERLWLRALDVTVDAERRAVVDEAEREWGGVDVLVNNAGLAWRSVVEHVAEEERIEQVHVNFRGPMGLIVSALPGMRRRRAGRIINVSSVAGMMAMPTMAIYSASKWALEGMSEALWYEVRPWGIHVTLVEPGFINSDGFENTRYTRQSRLSTADEDDPYHVHYEEMSGFVQRLMRYTWARPERVAACILRVMQQRRPPLRVRATWDAHLFALLRKWVPRGLYHELLYRMLPNVRRWGPAAEIATIVAEDGEEWTDEENLPTLARPTPLALPDRALPPVADPAPEPPVRAEPPRLPE